MPYITIKIPGLADLAGHRSDSNIHVAVEKLQKSVAVAAAESAPELKIIPTDLWVYVESPFSWNVSVTRVIVEALEREDRTPEIMAKLGKAIGDHVSAWLATQVMDPAVSVTVLPLIDRKTYYEVRCPE